MRGLHAGTGGSRIRSHHSLQTGNQGGKGRKETQRDVKCRRHSIASVKDNAEKQRLRKSHKVRMREGRGKSPAMSRTK